MTPRSDRRDVHIHLYLNDPEEKRAYLFLQKRKSQNRRWIAQAINAYADAQNRRPPPQPKQTPGPEIASALGRLQAQLDSISQRLDSIEQLVRTRPQAPPRQEMPAPSAPGPSGPAYKSGAGFSDDDLRAEAAQIPKNVLAGFEAFTGRRDGR